MATLNGTVRAVLATQINAGLRSQVQRLCPVRTGQLRRSVKIRVLERHGAIVLRAELADYFRHVGASGVSGSLTNAIGKLLLDALRTAVITGGRVYLLTLLNAWGLPQQSQLSRNIPARSY